MIPFGCHCGPIPVPLPEYARPEPPATAKDTGEKPTASDDAARPQQDDYG
jgi:hypothetical protein